jgi:hypothetical protein
LSQAKSDLDSGFGVLQYKQPCEWHLLAQLKLELDQLAVRIEEAMPVEPAHRQRVAEHRCRALQTIQLP